MSFKGRQISRLNSLEENTCKCSSKSSHKCPLHLESESFEDGMYTSETQRDADIESETFKTKLDISLSRTAWLIQDYLEFKAARSIQRFVRGWLYSCLYKRKRCAAIRIQTEWRRFYCQRLYFLKLETELQHRIEQHFYRAAQKIQALWRGWWVRHYVHDLTHLKRVQLLAGEELLYCVAFKMHHLLRTHHIPGVYSLRNSNVLSKVEQLLTSLRFKAFNQQSIQAMKQRCLERRDAERQHKKSAFGTKIPFPKNYINNLSEQKCSTLYRAKDADTRMARIINMYEEENKRMSKKKIMGKKLASFTEPLLKNPSLEVSSFCGDIVKSMKKWKIITEKNLSVDSNIFKSPENLENFLKEMDSKLSIFVHPNRACDSECLKDSYKTEKKYQNKRRITAKTLTHNGFESPVTCNDDQPLVKTRSGCSIISSVEFSMDKEKLTLLESGNGNNKHVSWNSSTSDNVL